MQAMTSGRFRHVPVVDQGQVVGMISVRDVLACQLAQSCAKTSTPPGFTDSAARRRISI